MAGRPKSKFASELETLFEEYEEDIFSNGKLLPPSNAIWRDLRDKCSMEKTEKSIYTAALKWYKKQTSSDNKNDAKEGDVNDISVETSFNQSLDTSESSNDSSPGSNAKKIEIKISAKVWRTIAPKETTSKRIREGSHNTGIRKYMCLEPGLWTDIFANEISKHDEIPCSWVFKRNKCYVSGSKFLEFEGKCNSCNAIIKGTLKKNQKTTKLLKFPYKYTESI